VSVGLASGTIGEGVSVGVIACVSVEVGVGVVVSDPTGVGVGVLEPLKDMLGL
jgi:hypothetical protein